MSLSQTVCEWVSNPSELYDYCIRIYKNNDMQSKQIQRRAEKMLSKQSMLW